MPKIHPTLIKEKPFPSHRIHLPLVFLQINVPYALFQSLVAQLFRFYRPIVEIIAGHRTLGQASMVLLVGALVDRPDGVVLDFRLKTDGRSDVAGGFLGLIRRDIGAIFKGKKIQYSVNQACR